VKKTSLLSFTADTITPAHLNLIDRGSELGSVTVAVMSDESLWGIRSLPVLTLDERINLIRRLEGVDRVITQHSWSYREILDLVKPDFFLHGSRWDQGNSPEIIRNQLGTWGGKLIESEFREKEAWLEPSHRAGKTDLSRHTLPSADSRRASLGRILKFNRPVIAIEAHNPLSAMVAESVSIKRSGGKNGNETFFDALWSSSLTDSTSRAFPDIEAISLESRIANIREMFRVSSRPLIMDLDTGGEPEVLSLRVRELETLGVSAGVIEDKVGLKRNSLLGNDVHQQQSSIEQFTRKIELVKENQLSREFMLVARVESLILEAGMEDALERSEAYVQAGADAVMIHSRHTDPSEIFEFLSLFRKKDDSTPLVVVPTSFNSVRAEDLYVRGANLIIYANHMLRAAVPAMQNAAMEILKNGRSQEIENQLLSVDEILSLIPGTK
jgi:phosphoenolpyruvate phosphomutase